jgi:hypothetical protein
MTSDFYKTIKHFIKPTFMTESRITSKKKLWRRYSGTQLSDDNQKFSLGMPHDNMAPYCKWTVRGLSNDEIVLWLRKVKHNAPAFIYEGLLALAEKELTKIRWELIKNTLSKEVIND